MVCDMLICDMSTVMEHVEYRNANVMINDSYEKVEIQCRYRCPCYRTWNNYMLVKSVCRLGHAMLYLMML